MLLDLCDCSLFLDVRHAEPAAPGGYIVDCGLNDADAQLVFEERRHGNRSGSATSMAMPLSCETFIGIN